jgi:hypothetical protein
LDDTALGNTALDGAAGFAADFDAEGFFSGSLAAAGLVSGAVVVVAPFAAHSLRKSLHDLSPSVPAAFATWYFSLHSFCVKAAAGSAPNRLANRPIETPVDALLANIELPPWFRRDPRVATLCA